MTYRHLIGLALALSCGIPIIPFSRRMMFPTSMASGSLLAFRSWQYWQAVKGLFVRECVEGSRCSRKTFCECVCVCGKMYLLLVRGVSRSKTLIPLILVTIRLDAFYYNNK